jgi:hypothetical protein
MKTLLSIILLIALSSPASARPVGGCPNGQCAARPLRSVLVRPVRSAGVLVRTERTRVAVRVARRPWRLRWWR